MSDIHFLGVQVLNVQHLLIFYKFCITVDCPLLASHSNIRELADHKRNLTLDMIQAIHDTKGSIGINLYKGFLNTNPKNATRVDALAMFGKMIEITDTRTVHSGADMDGAKFPEGIIDVRDVKELIYDVQREFGLGTDELEAISKGNVKRLMKVIWK